MSREPGEEISSKDRSPPPTYVYPVRSLLSGRIQPANSQNAQTESEPTSAVNADFESHRGASSFLNVRRNSFGIEKEPSRTPLYTVQAHSVGVVPIETSNDESDIASSYNNQESLFHPALAHLSHNHPDSNFNVDRAPSISADAPVFHVPGPVISGQNFVAGPVGEPVPICDPSPDSDIDMGGVRHPAQLSEVAGSAFTVTTTFESVAQGDTEHARNPSEMGIVHLPPLSLSSVPSTSCEDKYSGSSAVKSWVSQQARPVNLAGSVEKGSDGNAHAHTGDILSLPPSSSPGGTAGADTDEHFMTVRYEHVEDENGHHVVTGREGHLTKCEDEPIRTPGAVQGFGVLIAVDEDVDQGTLLVRQVSENSADILGLSPKFLFSLECFTDTLSEAQADVLWDNIQFLNEPSVSADGQEESPHVFLLSGFGEPGSAGPGDDHASGGKRLWTCWCAVHRPPSLTIGDGSAPHHQSGSIVMEFELERDTINPLYPIESMPSSGSAGSPPGSESTGDSSETLVSADVGAVAVISDGGRSLGRPTIPIHHPSSDDNDGDDAGEWKPSAEDILTSTMNHAKPIPALERLRRMSASAPTPPVQTVGSRARRQGGRRTAGAAGVGMMDVFAVMAQINEQLGATTDLDFCLKVVVGIIKDLTQFHRVLVYQFDDVWNGQVVAELVDWSQSHELYNGLHFPAADIPAQARELYTLNTVRILYDRSQPTARIVVRNKSDLETPLNLTHSYLRAMSPIHLKYLENMGVRASLSVSIMAFGSLWGLVSCHSYGQRGMRVSFPVRQMLRLLSQTISRNVERLSYARRLQSRKLVEPVVPDNTGDCIVSNADDLLTLFDADYGILVIGEGAKILGPNLHGQEILVMAEYLRLKQFNTIQVSQAVIKDFPDLQLSTGLEVIAGLLYVPLSSGGKDFIAMLRKGQPRNVKWAGRPTKGPSGSLEPRKSFKMWSEIVAGRSRAWTQEELETASVLSLVYGKFIEVWRQKESAMHATNLTNILLSNASHEVRTPLNHIINYLELAMNGPLDGETRDNLSRSHAASKNLLFTINDLLDLTRLESGKEMSFNEPFNLRSAIEDSVRIYSNEAARRNIDFRVDVAEGPRGVVGDIKKIKTVVANLTANALKYTTEGSVSVQCRRYDDPEGLRGPSQAAVEIIVADTGCGIPSDKLESIFREFEQVESSAPTNTAVPGVGLGLAVVARIVEQLGGQLRVDSQLGTGSRFSFLIPLELSHAGSELGISSSSSAHTRTHTRSGSSIRSRAGGSGGNSAIHEVGTLVQALSSTHVNSPPSQHAVGSLPETPEVHEDRAKQASTPPEPAGAPSEPMHKEESMAPPSSQLAGGDPFTNLPKNLRVLIVEDNDINRKLLAKRLAKDGHTVAWATNGQEGLEMIESDREFDCVLMDIQMPILNGFEATERIRDLEKTTPDRPPMPRRRSHELNGRIPIFAVSASLFEQQRIEITNHGIDGWILKPIDFARLKEILKGVIDPIQRNSDVYRPGCNWETGGWFAKSPS